MKGGSMILPMKTSINLSSDATKRDTFSLLDVQNEWEENNTHVQYFWYLVLPPLFP